MVIIHTCMAYLHKPFISFCSLYLVLRPEALQQQILFPTRHPARGRPLSHNISHPHSAVAPHQRWPHLLDDRPVCGCRQGISTWWLSGDLFQHPLLQLSGVLRWDGTWVCSPQCPEHDEHVRMNMHIVMCATFAASCVSHCSSPLNWKAGSSAASSHPCHLTQTLEPTKTLAAASDESARIAGHSRPAIGYSEPSSLTSVSVSSVGTSTHAAKTAENDERWPAALTSV